MSYLMLRKSKSIKIKNIYIKSENVDDYIDPCCLALCQEKELDDDGDDDHCCLWSFSGWLVTTSITVAMATLTQLALCLLFTSPERSLSPRLSAAAASLYSSPSHPSSHLCFLWPSVISLSHHTHTIFSPRSKGILNLVQAGANSYQGAAFGPLSFLIRPSELEEIKLIVSQS